MRSLTALFVVVAVAGCTKDLPAPNGVRVTGQDLRDLFTDATVYGRSLTRKRGVVQHYRPNGSYDVAFTKTRYSDEYGPKHPGKWRIEDDRVCYEVASLGSNGCAIVYRQYTQIEFVSPETGRTELFSYEIEYPGKKLPPPTASAAPPAAAPTPSAPQPTAPRQPWIGLEPAGSGSGFVVSNETYVLTNYHVIKGCRAVTVRLDDRDIAAAIRARDRQNDLALLRLPPGDHPVAAFQANNRLYPGDSVVAIGYPLSRVLASDGTVSVGTVSALAGVGNNASRLQISNPVQPGNSGGPLFDLSGHVVGVIVSGLSESFTLETFGALPQNVNFAIKSVVATTFMETSGVEYQSEDSTEELRPADVARKGRPAAVYIRCWK